MKKLVVLAMVALASLGLLMTLGGNQTQATDIPVSCGDVLTVAGHDYELTGNLTCSGAGLTIGADDITLDCRGKSLTGDGTGLGIFLDGVSGVTVRNCHVKDFAAGIVLNGSSGNLLVKNKATGNTIFGNGGRHHRDHRHELQLLGYGVHAGHWFGVRHPEPGAQGQPQW